MRIQDKALERILDHVRQCLPHECCGIMMAAADDPKTVSMALPAENAERDRPATRYLLGHKAHLRAVEMEARGIARIAGFYHSHPDAPAWPSESDVEAALGGLTYLIVAVSEEALQCRAWAREGDQIVIEPLRIIKE